MSEQREADEEVMRTLASRLQATAEAHLEACWAAADDGDDWGPDVHVVGEDEEALESPTTAPFCGCTTCVVREVLEISWPLVEEYVDARLRIAQAERSDA